MEKLKLKTYLRKHNKQLQLDSVSKIKPSPNRFRDNGFFRLVLQTQMATANSLDVVWFWKVDISKTTISTAYNERLKTVYHKPIPVFFHISLSTVSKKKTAFNVEDDYDHEVKVNLVEIIRLGEIFNTSEVTGIDFLSYIPKNDDLYQYNGSIFKIHDSDIEESPYFKLLKKPVVWKAKATLYSFESGDDNNVKIIEEEPYIEKEKWI